MFCQSQWSCGLRRRSAVVRLLGLRVRIPPGHGCPSLASVMFLSDRGLCNGPITRPEQSYQVWRVWVLVLPHPRWWGKQGRKTQQERRQRVAETIKIVFLNIRGCLIFFFHVLNDSASFLLKDRDTNAKGGTYSPMLRLLQDSKID